jgi:hypothetical protein
LSDKASVSKKLLKTSKRSSKKKKGKKIRASIAVVTKGKEGKTADV